MHRVGFAWDRTRGSGNDQLRWYLDGRLVHTLNQRDPRIAPVWASMTGHAGYFVILNVAMGGQFPAAFGGGPDSRTASGVPMLVDYVHVDMVRGSGSTPPPATPPPPAGSSGRQTAVITAGPAAARVRSGDVLRYRRVDFGSTPKASLVTRLASGAPTGSVLVEVRLDSPTAPPIGSYAAGNTGGWTSWRNLPANIAPTRGVHDVYLTLKSDDRGDRLALSRFTFGTTPAVHL
jgi:hypothetical protein